MRSFVRPVLTLMLAALVAMPALAFDAPATEPMRSALSDEALFPPGAMYEAAAAALADCDDAACRVAAFEAFTDDVRAELAALPSGAPGVAVMTQLVLTRSGHDARPLPVDASPDLSDALHRLYGVLDVPVDSALARDIATQGARLSVAQAAALTDLVDAIRVAHVETLEILPPADVALLREDLRATMKLTTFVGSAPAGSAPADWQALWDERASVLAAADLDALGRAAQTVAVAVTDYLESDTDSGTTGCEPSLDLVLVRVSGTCDDTYTSDDLFVLLIDEGGDDTYQNGAGAGVFAGAGIGISIDRGDGADTYDATTSAQGFGLAGVGLLADEGGPDRYAVTTFGQGFGVAGLGLLHDMGDADDVYLSPATDSADPIGTKAGALAGVGIMRDEGGNDYYRQDGLDGFVYGAAGGAGWMIEDGGDDTYVSNEIEIVLLGESLGNFTGPIQVSGEVGGTTVLYEAAGDDTYVCGDHVRQGCQGAAGAGSITLLLEEAGHDIYTMGVSVSAELVPGVVIFPMGQGSAYGPTAPAGLALLRDVDGDDIYSAQKWAQGFGTVGVGLLLDETGTDAYSVGVPLVGERTNGGTWIDGIGGIGVDQ